MKTVAITGSRGLLGATLMQELPKLGFKAVALAADITQKQNLLEEVALVRPDWIVHTAAKTDVGACEREPEEAHMVNAVGTQNVTEAAKSVGASLVYISTASVFSGFEGNYKEEDAPMPTNVYNKTKVEGEQAVASYEKGMVLRLNLVGVHPNGSRGKNFMEWLFDTVSQNKDMNLFNDQYINPLSNWTIANMIAMIIEKNLHEKFLHIGSSDVVSKADIGRLVLKKFPNYSGKVMEKSIDTIADGVVRPKQMWINTEHAAELLGPMPRVQDEIESIFRESLTI
ncbi:MAG TPA: SDR family oxidoreductase [Candidatus Paceibacterota bacterium]|nr:SDR family oxidoreductase [Candidatus Paceibacterota bacterium]